MVKKSYFVIDDSNFARKVVINVFGKLGYDFKGEANNYRTALAGIKELTSKNISIDYITLDITMPEITGDKLIPLILESLPNVKIVMTTSVADKETVSRCVTSGAKGYILKPITEEKVLETMNLITINSLLNKKD